MSIWSDYNPVRITSGPGAVKRLFSLEPAVTGGKRTLMVTSPGFKARGITEEIEAEAKKTGLENPILVFDGVTANPELDFLDRIATALRGETITGIIALGGGSVLDTAKVFSVTLPSDMKTPLDMVLREGRPHKWESYIPVIAIPTTAGTGAEVTPFATVWDNRNKKKYSVSGEMVYPVHALLDPELTLTLPPKETLYTGLDAISHALESLWNKNRTRVSEALSLKALTLANNALPAVLNQPESLYYREKMQHAALIAGLAISRTRTAIAHAISYPVTMHFGVPHGLACSFTLPRLIKHYTNSIDDGPIKTAMNETLKILEELNLENELLDYIGKENLSKYIEGMFHPERSNNYSGIMTIPDISRLVAIEPKK
ncbi:MAG: phosphonoacetaldehyde reductase [Sedimentisphaerales bacterium]|nr:phosphonoacetaldehyde reductase [Sedimentisphaerales bacterium]